VPLHGGVLLASNHQSWMDVQVLVAACPRRVHFIAKREFERWPVLRHLIRSPSRSSCTAAATRPPSTR